MRILIAPNAFKNSLTAFAAAQAIEEGLHESFLQCTTECFPIGDGGDGTGELIVRKLCGEMIQAKVHDPFDRLINSSFGLIEGGQTAVIEMADASGLRLLTADELNPLTASSFGTGELMKAALDCGVKKIIVGMGGSATVDGGCGMLKALGIQFFDSAGNELSGLPESFVQLNKIDASNLDKRILACEVIVLCDVDNSLLGDTGAAAVFGPQKGATAEGVEKLERALAQFANVSLQQTGKDISDLKSGGTAGGAAAGLYAHLNAKLVNGIDYFLQLTNFEAALQQTDLVFTGEGSIDEQTLNGKGPFGVAFQARKHDLKVIGLAGKVPLKKNKALATYFDVLLAIGHEPCTLQSAMMCTNENLKRTAMEIGNLLAMAGCEKKG